jgi:hypothetical protein
MLTRIVTGFFAVVLAYFTVVQYNDPDGWLWAAFYGAGMAIAAAAAFGRYSRAATLIVIVVGIVVAGRLSPAVLEWLLHHKPADLITGMSPSRPYIEEARECLGTLIAMAMMVYVYRQIPARSGSAPREADVENSSHSIPAKGML